MMSIDRHPRVQRSERVLEDELHLPPKPLQILALQREHVDQRPRSLKVIDPAIGRHGAQQQFAQGGLAAPALADQSETFAALDPQADHRRRQPRAAPIFRCRTTRSCGA